jgi:hypothetical protein
VGSRGVLPEDVTNAAEIEGSRLHARQFLHRRRRAPIAILDDDRMMEPNRHWCCEGRSTATWRVLVAGPVGA